MDANLMVILTATLAVTSGSIIGSFSEFTFYKNTLER